MTSPRDVNVAALLAAAYRRPAEEVDRLAARVRARMALIETLGECVRLLVEAPASVVSATLGTVPEQKGEKEGDD